MTRRGFENWESEFLQMGAYVLLTAYLVQRGSSESKPEPETDPPADHADHTTPSSPWPVRVGGLVLALYRNSLAIALPLLFGISFVLHLLGGTAEYNEKQALESGRQAGRRVSRVISLGAKIRSGGPQNPVPRLV
ncbi:DUF6766 family protein [Plantactinospora sp. WMMB334]|uniref:DUF6766 family protein n=1 Tax=Plantactinospora sp. WMMB334 TaxID=3404119 RepID=UPI003B9549FA